MRPPQSKKINLKIALLLTVRWVAVNVITFNKNSKTVVYQCCTSPPATATKRVSLLIILTMATTHKCNRHGACHKKIQHEPECCTNTFKRRGGKNPLTKCWPCRVKKADPADADHDGHDAKPADDGDGADGVTDDAAAIVADTVAGAVTGDPGTGNAGQSNAVSATGSASKPYRTVAKKARSIPPHASAKPLQPSADAPVRMSNAAPGGSWATNANMGYPAPQASATYIHPSSGPTHYGSPGHEQRAAAYIHRQPSEPPHYSSPGPQQRAATYQPSEPPHYGSATPSSSGGYLPLHASWSPPYVVDPIACISPHHPMQSYHFTPIYNGDMRPRERDFTFASYEHQSAMPLPPNPYVGTEHVGPKTSGATKLWLNQSAQAYNVGRRESEMLGHHYVFPNLPPMPNEWSERSPIAWNLLYDLCEKVNYGDEDVLQALMQSVWEGENQLCPWDTQTPSQCCDAIYGYPLTQLTHLVDAIYDSGARADGTESDRVYIFPFFKEANHKLAQYCQDYYDCSFVLMKKKNP
jgi:hypothetical protein